MDLVFSSDHPSFSFTQEDLFKNKAISLLESEGFKKDLFLNVVFLSDEQLLSINKEYLDHDYYTDIITFPIEEDEGALEAEIYISVDRVEDNAKDYSANSDTELLRVFLHGILHLVGYEDATKEQKDLMRSKEDYYLNL